MDNSETGQTAETAGSNKRSGATGRSTIIAVIAGVVLVLVVAGVAAAALIPSVGASAQTSIGSMLPATTVGYVAADLNPTGATQSELNRIRTAFTSQPGWAETPLAREASTKLAQQSGGSSCAKKVQRGLNGELHDLGHDTAFALTSVAGVNVRQAFSPGALPATNAANIQALKQDFVVLAPLHVQMTLFQALTTSGLTFATQTTEGSYHGVTVYAERVTGCSTTSPSSTYTFYAAEMKNWVVIGLVPQALYPVINTASGKRADLSTVSSYSTLMAHLPANQLGSFYVDGAALKKAGISQALKEQPAMGSLSASAGLTNLQGLFHPAAGAISVDANGLTAMSLSQQPGSTATRSGGILASALPSTAAVFISISDAKATLSRYMTAVLSLTPPATSTLNGSISATTSPLGDQRSKILTDLAYITANMSGEADIVSFKPAAATPSGSRPGLTGSGLSGAVMWKVNSDAAASANLSNLVRSTGLSNQLTSSVFSDGTTYYANAQGEGYAVRKGWAIVSSNIADTLADLTKKPAQTLSSQAAYTRAVPVGATGSSVWFANLAELRPAVEAYTTVLSASPSAGTTPDSYMALVKPLQALSGSTGSLDGFKYGFLRVDIR